MKRKILSVVLSITLLLTVLACILSASLSASAAGIYYERDESWYNSSQPVLYIEDIPDFLEFMYQLELRSPVQDLSGYDSPRSIPQISVSGAIPFEGQTVVLATDIILNEGIRFTSEGPSDYQALCFERMGKQICFGGVFDGAGHTISGLFISANTITGGSIFGLAGSAMRESSTAVTVKNLQIKNSYITSTEMGVATIFSGVPYGRDAIIENVYSNAYLKSEHSSDETKVLMGGFCSDVGGNLMLEDCVYAGEMVCVGDAPDYVHKGIGGIVATISSNKFDSVNYRGRVKFYESAFYGRFISDNASYVGKVVGTVDSSNDVEYPSLTVRNSILAGKISIGNGFSIGNITGHAYSIANSDVNVVDNRICIFDSVYTPMYVNNSEVMNDIGEIEAGAILEGSAKKVLDDDLRGEYALNNINVLSKEEWVANADLNGYPLPVGIVNTFSEESLKNDFIVSNYPHKDELLAALGAHIENPGIYTNSSFEAYMDRYHSILVRIDTDSASYTVSEILELKSVAEDLLITVEEYRASILSKLGAKKDNNGKYTAASYAEYSKAFDNIVDAIYSAGTDIDSINLDELKDAAEAKLQLATEQNNTIISNKNETASTVVSIDYVLNSTVHTIYSVDVIWSDISFTYNTIVPQWNPETHNYEVPAGYSKWSDSSGKVIVVNHSNTDVKVDIAFDNTGISNGTARLSVSTPSFTIPNAAGTELANAPAKVVNVSAVGTPKQNGVIGHLRVKIS